MRLSKHLFTSTFFFANHAHHRGKAGPDHSDFDVHKLRPWCLFFAGFATFRALTFSTRPSFSCRQPSCCVSPKHSTHRKAQIKDWGGRMKIKTLFFLTRPPRSPSINPPSFPICWKSDFEFLNHQVRRIPLSVSSFSPPLALVRHYRFPRRSIRSSQGRGGARPCHLPIQTPRLMNRTLGLCVSG